MSPRHPASRPDRSIGSLQPGTTGGEQPPPPGGGALRMSALPSRVPQVGVRSDAWLALGVAVLAVLGSAVALKDDLWAALPGLTGPLIPRPTELLLLLAGTLPLAFRR